MAYEALAVANEFIRKSKGRSLSPMKLQKLVYYAHGWFLAIRDSALVKENVEAWQFGPVIPELYREFKHYGETDITAPATRIDYRSFKTYEPRLDDEGDLDCQFASKVVGDVWKVYKDYSATRLSNATHKPGTPWSDTYIPGRKSIVIPNELIRAYFKAL